MRISDQVHLTTLFVVVLVLVSMSAVEGQEIRLRVNEPIKYEGFTYRGRHWVEGILLHQDADVTILKMLRGGGAVTVPNHTVTECQTRANSEDSWKPTEWPLVITPSRESEHTRPRTLMDVHDVLKTNHSPWTWAAHLGGGWYHMPKSSWSRMWSALDVHLAGSHANYATLGFSLRNSKRRSHEVALSVYGVQDRNFLAGEQFEADYSVVSLELGQFVSREVWGVTLGLIGSGGVARITDERKAPGVDVNDSLLAWPWSLGVRLQSCSSSDRGTHYFAEARYRHLPLTIGNQYIFHLGGSFLTLGVLYRHGD
jgi:hypothetical protein